MTNDYRETNRRRWGEGAEKLQQLGVVEVDRFTDFAYRK